MKKEELTPKLFCLMLSTIGGFGNHVTRGQGWSSVFILDYNHVQIGKCTFKDGKYYYLKSYKRDYHIKIDDTDFIFCQLDRLFENKPTLPVTVLHRLKVEAMRAAKTGSAKKLKPRLLFAKLVQEYNQ
jgi:hypothetical protein